MATTAVRGYRVALALEAYGIGVRLWKEPAERDWSATLRDDGKTIDVHFQEDNLTLAKLHALGEARKLVISRSGSAALPSCDTLLDSWKPVKM